MADSWDLLAGLTQGTNRALDSYLTTKDKEKDRKTQLGLLKAEKGLIPKVDESGNAVEDEYVDDPAYIAKKLAERKKDNLDKGIIVDYDKNEYQYSPGKIAGEAAIKNAQRDPLQEEYTRAKINELKNKQPGLTPGQESADKTFGKEYVDWTSAGRATTEKNLTRLEQAKEQLKNNPGLTGRVKGNLPDWMRSNDSLTVQQDVQAAAQGALKATLGSQFTEKEGERIMKMAFDPTLPAEKNIAKIDAALKEIQQIKETRDAQSQAFEKQGTLSRGFLAKPEGLLQPQEKSANTPKASIPKIGDVVDGYSYKGGDPSKSENWEMSRKAGR